MQVDADSLLSGIGQVFAGGQSHLLPVDNQTLADIPLFVRCGQKNARLPVRDAGNC